MVKFYGLYSNSDLTYLVSPWAANGCLTTFLQDHEDVDRARLLRETADALQYLHVKRIIHGDVKGSNILITERVQVKLCDFGLSRLASIPTAVALKGSGTHRYMAPEVWKGEGKSFATDTFSFGITIYEVLSGKKPFSHLLEEALYLAISRGERPPKNPEVSPKSESWTPLWNIAERCWAPEPEDRPPMQAVFRDLCEVSPLEERSSLHPSTSEELTSFQPVSPISTKTENTIRRKRSVVRAVISSLLPITEPPKRTPGTSAGARPSTATPAGHPVQLPPNSSASSYRAPTSHGLHVAIK
ncbi:hypothetical protein FRB99_004264 [Tulasnella sp. 403]|nr:hypothetical protein FRB99_004264 [Tulasnella sp. 403]